MAFAKKNSARKKRASTKRFVNNEANSIAENLYKKNIELLTTNRTLSLLRKLYEISISTIEPKEIASKICHTIQSDLSFEGVGIYIYEKGSNSLYPLSFSQSDRAKEAFQNGNLKIAEKTIGDVNTNLILRQVIEKNAENNVNKLTELWGKYLDAKTAEKIAVDSHIKTTLLRPLKVERKVLGMVVISLNRTLEDLSSFEKESVGSFVNVIALALEKAFLYQELQIANDQLRELDRQKDELLGIVSHQLATPITSIKWYTEMMLDGDLGKLKKEQAEHVKSMQLIAGNLSDLVSMILDVSRIQLGRIHIEKQELDLNQFFAEILSVIEPKAKEKGVKFEKSMPAKLPKAMLDSRYTRMTLENLLSNAVKYTPKNGNVAMELKIEGSVLHFRVTDTGMGIPKAEQDKIFGKLFRASNVRNTVDGNGFGLYVAKGAVEAQGGTISFDSTEGKGTTFSVELPLK